MIIALVEQTGGSPELLSLEMLALARRLAEVAGAAGGQVHAILFGAEAHMAAAGLAAHGVATASVVEHERLDDYAPEAWAASLLQLMAQRSPTVVIAAGSERGSEIMAHVAARAGLPLAANCTDVRPGDRLGITRQRWAGSLLEDAWLDGPAWLLTVAPHAVAIEETAAAGTTVIERFTPALSEKDLRVRVSGRVAPDPGRVSLTDARVVVGGGRGVGGAEGFADLEELARLLGGAVGVSRAVTSAGWRPHAEQIGQTGLRIAPDLYIACGISGAIQHIVGCKAAKQILAINSDPEAPIMEKATYAVIGDLRAIVPAISAEIRRARGD
jgi:electron transfer flavoprotein alpha subunit